MTLGYTDRFLDHLVDNSSLLKTANVCMKANRIKIDPPTATISDQPRFVLGSIDTGCLDRSRDWDLFKSILVFIPAFIFKLLFNLDRSIS